LNRNDGTLRVSSETGPLYQSVGASLYPMWAGTTYDYPYRMMVHGKANGLTSFRAVLLFEQFNKNPSQVNLWSDAVWKPIDGVLAAARDLDIHVTVELSGLANWMISNKLDPYNQTYYPGLL
jgi:hypothetical protein